jgi:hypothetical protein
MKTQNPLKLNKLQLRTLALLQELSRQEDFSIRDPASGEVTIAPLPQAHGDHVHIGRFVVAARAASGFNNPSVLSALERKGLARANYPIAVILTDAGQAYDTGLSGPSLGLGQD